MTKLALYARSQNELAMKLSGHLTPNHLVLFVSQITVQLGGLVSPTVGKYSNSVEHFSTNIIKLWASGAQKTTERDDAGMIEAYDVLWTITKSKQAPVRGATGNYTFYPALAEIDSNQELIDLAGMYGIIDSSSKGWYGYGGDKMRRSELVEILSDPDERQKILDTVESMSDA